MLSDAVQRQRRLERFVLVIAQCLQKDDPERNVALDSRVLPAIKRTMVEEAVNRLLNTNEKPMLVLKEVFDSYKACAGAYENKAHFKRQVFRRLRKALIR